VRRSHPSKGTSMMETIINICVLVLALIGVLTIIGVFVLGLLMFLEEK
jgi:hypothetical protein